MADCRGTAGARARALVVAFGLLSIAPLWAPIEAQQLLKVPKVGFLSGGTEAGLAVLVAALKQGMRELAYVEGKTYVLDARYGDGKPERLPDLARELVARNVDVIVASTDQPITAVKRETRTIPIVMTSGTDPVGTGLVASLAHPGGEITRLTNISPDPRGKRLGLLGGDVAGLPRRAALGPRRPGHRTRFQGIRGGRHVAPSRASVRRSVPRRRSQSRLLDRDESARAGDDGAPRHSRYLLEAGRDRRLRPEKSAAVHVRTQGVRGCGRPHVLWAESIRQLPPRRHLRRQDPQRGETSRASRGATFDVRAGSESQDGTRAGPDTVSLPAAARGSADPVERGRERAADRPAAPAAGGSSARHGQGHVRDGPGAAGHAAHGAAAQRARACTR